MNDFLAFEEHLSQGSLSTLTLSHKRNDSALLKGRENSSLGFRAINQRERREAIYPENPASAAGFSG
jgi:hypothetical protein